LTCPCSPPSRLRLAFAQSSLCPCLRCQVLPAIHVMCIYLPSSTSAYPLLARPLYRAPLSVTACRFTRGVAGSSLRWRSRRCLLRRDPAMRWTWLGRETRRRKRRALGRRPPDSGVTSPSSGVQGVSRAPFCFRTVHCALHSKPRLRRPGRKAERRTRPCSHLCDATLGGRLVDLSAFILRSVVPRQFPTPPMIPYRAQLTPTQLQVLRCAPEPLPAPPT
jgi:hypothetical protein